MILSILKLSMNFVSLLVLSLCVVIVVSALVIMCVQFNLLSTYN